MKQNTKNLTHGAAIGALYVVLTQAQNLLLPGSATWVVQFRAAEALVVLAAFTPAAVPGLTLGCVVFNLTFAGSLPLDFLVGGYATFLAAGAMRLSRNFRPGGLPIPGLLAPAVFNGLLVGWELTFYLGTADFSMGAFWTNALYVAAGELAVMLTLGAALYRALQKNGLGRRLFDAGY